MDKSVPIPKTDIDYEAEVDFYIAAMKRLQQSMAEDREEIKTLQEETRASLAEVMAILKAA